MTPTPETPISVLAMAEEESARGWLNVHGWLQQHALACGDHLARAVADGFPPALIGWYTHRYQVARAAMALGARREAGGQ